LTFAVVIIIVNCRLYAILFSKTLVHVAYIVLIATKTAA